MDWAAVIEDQSLQNLPYKIETNRFGQIVMSPASNRRGINQAKITTWLGTFGAPGAAITECSVQTDEGVKVADVAWASPEFIERNESYIAYPQAPEICVEIVSPSNSSIALTEKRALYFRYGAKEVWLCVLSGKMTFYDRDGVIPQSKRFPDFTEQL
jgi:Uma2 family endonuclease